jgi:hypothetical protein
MKKIFVICMGIISLNVFGQNVLTDGVKKARIVEFSDGDCNTVVKNAEISNVESGRVTYTYTFEYKDDLSHQVSTVKDTWNWGDITSIKVDKDLAVVQLGTNARVVEVINNSTDHVLSEDDRSYSVDIYFKDVNDADKAAEWVQTMVRVNTNGRIVPIQ